MSSGSYRWGWHHWVWTSDSALKNLPHLALVFNALVWGLSWIPYKWMESQGLSILWATAIGYLLSTAVLGLFQPTVLSRLLRRHPLWMMGLFYGLTNTCFNWRSPWGTWCGWCCCFT